MLLCAHSRIQHVTKKYSVIDGLAVDRDDFESKMNVKDMSGCALD
jgi:hypothetical protein